MLNDENLTNEELERGADLDNPEPDTEMDYKSMYDKTHSEYLRLYADFENFRKRTQREREVMERNIKAEANEPLMNVHNTLSIAFTMASEAEKKGLGLILDSLTAELAKSNIVPIPTDEYNSELHDVISLSNGEKDRIVAVASHGYTINGVAVRNPKVVLGNGE